MNFLRGFCKIARIVPKRPGLTKKPPIGLSRDWLWKSREWKWENNAGASGDQIPFGGNAHGLS